ncbi:hypothetical protein HS088_TW20G00089 [Tripterygium wilfordii]|uniref:Uncharacterized protein n=1 Tax=Tripterygium wilfordii TaxID=458696 RepID=A0A7J7C6Z5_TRIWF|nr:hypothetical protein HS088_TW20G00089 [Tripterygium wilfordii]
MNLGPNMLLGHKKELDVSIELHARYPVSRKFCFSNPESYSGNFTYGIVWFFGVIEEKLMDKSHLLPFYRTGHEIFTSHGSSFNSFEVIGSFYSLKNLVLPLRPEE